MANLTPQGKAFKYFVDRADLANVKLYRGKELITTGQLQLLPATSHTWAKVGRIEFKISDIDKLSIRKATIRLFV